MQRLVFIFILFFVVMCIQAQNTSDSLAFEPEFKRGVHYNLKTRSGNVYQGFVKSESREFVVLEDRKTRTSVEIRKTEILKNSESKPRELASNVMGENLHAGRYLLLSTAFLFESKKLSTCSHWLFLENISYAFNEHLALSVNTVAFYPVSLGLKCAFQISDDNYLGAHVFGLFNINSGSVNTLFFGYGAQGTFTRGNSNKNISFSGGVVGLSSDFFYTSIKNPFINTSFVSAAYCNRFAKKTALNIEGWYLPEVRSGIAGVGLKFIGDEVTCWSVGCYAFMNNQDNNLKINLKTLPVPYFGFSRQLR